MRLRGIGIDLVSVPRMRRFLKEHGPKAIRLLDSRPRQKHSGMTPPCLKKISPARLARIFAAKEAFFKALGRSWMGMEGFKTIQVQDSLHGGFRVQCAFLPKGAQVSGRFFSGPQWAGAQVMIWEP